MTTQNTSSIKSRSSVISRRIPAAALAIAIGAGVASVPQFTEAAPVAHAQETQTESQFSPNAVKFDGIKDKEGNVVNGTLLSPGYKSKHPDAEGTVIPDNGDFTFNFSIDVADAQGGDRVYIQPTTRYTPEFGSIAGKEQESHWVGTRVIGNVPNRPLEMNGVQIGTVDVIHGGGIRVTFNDAAGDFKSGTAHVSATAHSWDSFETSAENAEVRENGGPLSIQVSTYRANEKGKFPSTPAATAEIPTGNNTKFNSIQQETNALRNRVYTTAGAVSVTPEGEGILHFVKYQAPAGADYEVSLRANDVATDYEAQWLMTKNIKHSLAVAEYNEHGEPTGTIKNDKDISKKYPDMSVDVSFENGTIHIKVTNVPDGVQPILTFRGANKGALGVASYQPNAIFDFKRDYTPLDDTAKESQRAVGRTISRIPAVAGMPENEGTEYTRTADVTPMIAGFAKGVGTTGEPAPVAGTKQTFEFEVHNTGDTYMAAPEVTLPNGEKKIVPGVKIGPNETGVVQVEYNVPKDATRLDFGVDFPRYTLNAKNHTFRIGPVDHSEEERQKALDDINKNLEDQYTELVKQTDSLKKQADSLKKQVTELEKIKSELAKANELSEETNNKLQLQIDESKKQTDALNGLIKSNNEQTAVIEKQLSELNETQKLQLKESIKQSIDLSRIADALERRNQILIDQHKDQLKQWDIENGFAQDEQNDRKHSKNLKRCMATDPGTPLLFLIPAGLALMFNMPGMQPLVKSASDQIASLNHNIQKATGINNMLPADLQKNINNFNKQYGDVARAGGAGMAGLISAVVSAIAISNLINNCYADADKSVGRETPEPVKLSDSAFSSRK